MKKILSLLTMAIGVNLLSFAQTANYSVDLISDSLKQNANAVIREEFIEYSCLTPQKNIGKFRKVATVLNKNGDNLASLIVTYDKFRTITYVKGNIYDGSGKLVRKIKTSEFVDHPYSSTYNEFADSRFKAFKPLISDYPYTVEFEYEVSYDCTYFFPDMIMPDRHNLAVEKSGVTIKVPLNYQLNYKQFNIKDDQPEITRDEIQQTFRWSIENVPALDYEPHADDYYKVIPALYTAPSTFSIGGFQGNTNTWNDFAIWQQKVNTGRDELSETRVKEIKELVKDITEDRDKINRLYTYMQSRMRYFGIQLGIGGFQPMEAKVVDEVGFSDCKGLSNYMKALLKAVGIDSYYTMVQAGEGFPQVIPDFVYDPFNHIILCVPLKEDTVWLECTSQIKPFDFLGNFTSDRQALVVKEQGGELVRTPIYTLEENIQFTHAQVEITGDGNGTANILRNFGGLQFDDHIAHLYESPEDLKEWIYDYFPIPDFNLTSCEFKKNPDNKPESILKASVSFSQYASLSGKRLFLPLNITNRSTYVPAKVKHRTTDIRCTWSYIDADTAEFVIPEGFTIEFLPDSREIKTPFGEYLSRVEYRDGRIIYIRQVKKFKGIYPKEKYDDFIKFYYDMGVADKCQAILIKKEI